MSEHGADSTRILGRRRHECGQLGLGEALGVWVSAAVAQVTEGARHGPQRTGKLDGERRGLQLQETGRRSDFGRGAVRVRLDSVGEVRVHVGQCNVVGVAADAAVIKRDQLLWSAN